jgi:steroid 5-alpha reductase family enzyme
MIILGAVGIAIGLSLVMVGAWLLQRRTGNSGWADVSWTFGTGLGGAVAALLPVADGHSTSGRQLAVALLALFWSVRLGLHIRARTLGGGEDARYAQLRLDWGDRFQSRLFRFLQIQAIFALPLVAVIGLAAHDPAPGVRPADLLGVLVMAAALIGEAVADAQLARFRRASGNRRRICDAGLWSWSRHPNYFFEWLVWVGFAAIALPLSGEAYPQGWLGLVGPALMYWLLVHVSGIPPLESHMLASRGEDFRAYQRRTSAFFPLPPFAPGRRRL